MSPQTYLIALIPIAYLLGSIPFGLIVGKMKGIDPRTAGSGNIGATNLGRLLGGKYFAIVFTLDLLKGFLPMVMAGLVLGDQPPTRLHYMLWLLVGFAALSGHMFSIFLKFKGGKGVATGTGIALGVFPYFTFPVLVGALAFLIVFYFTKIVSISSIAGAMTLPIAYVVIGVVRGWDITGTQLPLLIFVVLLASLIVYRHRSNIARLLAGTENRFGKKDEG